MAVWHPDARRVVYEDLGPFTMDVEPRLVWHTIEGNHLPQYNGSHPHFTLDPRTGDLWQHSPINRVVKTLTNPPGGVETNRARAIQVELFGFAAQTDEWPDRWYAECADLARWIERNAGVKRVCTVGFTDDAHSMGALRWMGYEGHCGHQHVPENLSGHWDPGRFKIAKVLDVDDDVHRVFDGGERGPDVAAFQRAVRRIARNCCRPDHFIDVDGIFGLETLDHGAWACYIIGMRRSQDEIKQGGIGLREQTYARFWEERPEEVRERGRERRERHCRCGDAQARAFRSDEGESDAAPCAS